MKQKVDNILYDNLSLRIFISLLSDDFIIENFLKKLNK